MPGIHTDIVSQKNLTDSVRLKSFIKYFTLAIPYTEQHFWEIDDWCALVERTGVHQSRPTKFVCTRHVLVDPQSISPVSDKCSGSKVEPPRYHSSATASRNDSYS